MVCYFFVVYGGNDYISDTGCNHCSYLSEIPRNRKYKTVRYHCRCSLLSKQFVKLTGKQLLRESNFSLSLLDHIIFLCDTPFGNNTEYILLTPNRKYTGFWEKAVQFIF